ncbi:short-chain dehydrogenase/reductase family 9C member 7-like [Orbicella faveolata]|uniref:short-chain dehydrogenase/reductase family 9C member 7-like n=1 Tax=Orbicella faveolata TaxID=48498 RepID=UPI0009E4252D|nr:short-chain dehydrogenase/reductase family 9C member 7-like [Orbicella faveolata]
MFIYYLFHDVRVADLVKKAVLITACDSGFGYELAKKLDALGLRVFACLTSEGEAKLTKECSRELRTFKLDVAEASDVQKALEVLAKKLDALGLRVFACLTSEGEAKLTKECSQELKTFKLDVAETSDVQKALEVVKSGLPSQAKGIANTIGWIGSQHIYKVLDAMVHAVTSTQPKLQ